MPENRSVLVLGAGFVCRPLVRYLLDLPWIALTLADRIPGKAEELLEDHPRGRAVPLDITDEDGLDALIASHDFVVSLLPAPLHPQVARHCIAHGKSMATTSYISPEMRSLDAQAREAGLMLLNECGVDPGVDHMTAMRIFHDVRARGGRVLAFKSYCGGLPAPDSTNRVGYKFSWSARGALVAARNRARYLWDGVIHDIEPDDLLTDVHLIEIEGAGTFEAYPNRDAMPFRERYGLGDISSLFRGTLRTPGHCARWNAWIEAGLFDFYSPLPEGETRAGVVRAALRVGEDVDLVEAMAERMGVSIDHEWVTNLEWLGMFTETQAGPYARSPGDVLAGAMLSKMHYGPGERDMIVMHHDVVSVFEDHRERTIMDMVDFGIPDGDSAMARTVSLPLAIAIRGYLEGTYTLVGVRSPIMKELYGPVLDELEHLGIVCKETTEILDLD